MKKYIIIILLLYAVSAYAEKPSGTGLYFFGNSPVSMGIGGAGVAYLHEDLFYLNPASIANVENIGVNMMYGSVDGSFYNPAVSFWLPSSYGVLGAFLSYYAIDNSIDFTQGMHLAIGGGKGLTSHLFLGAAVDLFYGNADASIGYAGVKLGWIYTFTGMKGEGLGLFNPAFGLSARWGMPFAAKHEKDVVNFNSAAIGYNITFFRNDSVSAGLYNDLMFIHSSQELPVKAGLEFILFNHYIVRGGMSYPLDNQYGVYTCGLGYQFKSEYMRGAFNYALSYGGTGMLHYAGFSMKFGKPDRKPPRTLVTVDNSYISPNYDGKKDFVIFSITVYDESRIKGWKFQIRDKDKRSIKEFSLSERNIIDSLTMSEFFKRIVQKKETLVVPESIMWDGTDEKGNIVPDGNYSYSFIAWDERDNIAPIVQGTIVVDNTPPEVVLTLSDRLFSPNNDKQKDELIIQQQVKTSDDDVWHAGFVDEKNMQVKSYKWTGKDIPKEVRWDGKDNNGQPVPEGLYTFFIYTTDNAGNNASGKLQEITLIRAYEMADIYLSASEISYVRNKDIQFFLRLSSTKGLQNWKILVLDNEKKKTLKEITEPEFKKNITWDFKDNDGRKLADGIYFVKLEAVYASGNRPQSFAKQLLIDNREPELDLSISPKLFSPDGDRVDDILTIVPTCHESYGVQSWKIAIYSETGTVFKEFSGKSAPPTIIKWDGYGDKIINQDDPDKKKEKVVSAGVYFVDFMVTDIAGNSSKTKKLKFNVDILLLVVEEGYRIRLNNIDFNNQGETLTSPGKEMLDKIYDILTKYQHYAIVIEGHTDSRGREQQNLVLSEKMALAVKEYLATKGIARERMQIKGLGETVPVYADDRNGNKNKRIEFLLYDKSKQIKANNLVD